ncbi:MAG: hypothetical protein Q8N63_07840 [Nanoarchaeota archaeon]|nr:hypothetical protein [Nanoarchaeota archaeon]
MKKEITIVLISLFFINAINLSLILNPFLEVIPVTNLITGKGITTGSISLIIMGSGGLSISSPQNTTYNFSIGAPYIIDLNVLSDFNASSWWYTLEDKRNNLIIIDNLTFTPNTTITAVRWNNKVTVYANDTYNYIYNNNVEFFVSVPNSNPIIDNISNNILVCEGDYLSYLFNISDIDGDDLTVDISPKNPFYTSFYRSINSTLDTYEIFSGTLSKSNAGGANAGSKNYSETITASDDNSSDSKNTNITVIEINNAPSITNIGVQTIWARGENSSFNYQVIVSDAEDGNQSSGNLNFSITFSGESLFNISSRGVMNFTANSSYIGVHNISICVNDTGIDNLHQNISLCGQDGSSLTSCNNFSLTVTGQNRAPEIVSKFPVNLSFNASGSDLSYFNISKDDADGTIPDAYWYVNNIFKEYDSGNLVDTFYYSFGCGISGAHTIKAEITDGELNDSVQWNITVINVECPVGVSPGGGGGGGGGFVACAPKWACEQWPQCKNLKTGFQSWEISKEYDFLIKERCLLFNWSDDICGYQTRECNDLNLCKSNLTKPGLIRECHYTKFPTCFDKIKNCHTDGCEVLTDCGGPCESCPTCSDGIKNQNEEDIDCGGSCPLCIPELSSLQLISLIKVFVYLFLIVFIIALIWVTRLLLKSYKLLGEVKGVSEKKHRGIK